ncbi:uncharacterized protein LOC144866317 [Branchiostoma floridae x Branchiostoma japonicum]
MDDIEETEEVDPQLRFDGERVIYTPSVRNGGNPAIHGRSPRTVQRDSLPRYDGRERPPYSFPRRRVLSERDPEEDRRRSCPSCLTGAPSHVVVPMDRRLPKFSGTDPAVSVEDWLEEVFGAFHTWGTPRDQQAHAIWRHLEGDARREIAVLPPRDREDIHSIEVALREAFRDTTPSAVMRSNLFARRQERDENIRTFSLELQDLLRKILRRDPESIAEPDKVLRDQFIEGLRDVALRPALRQLIRRDPNLTFQDVRREALEMAEADGVVRSSARDARVRGGRTSEERDNAGSTEPRRPAPDAVQQQLNELRQQYRELGEQLRRGQQTDRAYQHLYDDAERYRAAVGPRPTDGGRPSWGESDRRNGSNNGRPGDRAWQHRFTPDGRPICSSCQEVGHMQRQCSAARPGSPAPRFMPFSAAGPNASRGLPPIFEGPAYNQRSN